jgi:uncharacterized coiled-coil protein SlyX
MSAQVLPPAAHEGFALLAAIAEVAKNPDIIVKAHKTLREQQALTDAEKAKVNEARQSISKATELQTKLDADKQAFEDEKGRHAIAATNLSARATHVERTEQLMNEREKELATQKRTLDSLSQTLQEQRNELAKNTAKLQEWEDKLTEKQKDLDDRFSNVAAALKGSKK